MRERSPRAFALVRTCARAHLRGCSLGRRLLLLLLLQLLLQLPLLVQLLLLLFLLTSAARLLPLSGALDAHGPAPARRQRRNDHISTCADIEGLRTLARITGSTRMPPRNEAPIRPSVAKLVHSHRIVTTGSSMANAKFGQSFFCPKKGRSKLGLRRCSCFPAPILARDACLCQDLEHRLRDQKQQRENRTSSKPEACERISERISG